MLVLISEAAPLAAFATAGAVVAAAAFGSAKAKKVDLALAVFGFGGFVATIAGMGPHYGAGPYVFVPLTAVFTSAWMTATVRVMCYRGLMRSSSPDPPG